MPAAKSGTCLEEGTGRLCFESGDTRTNQNLLLVSVHNVWFRNHNRLAKGLRRVNPHWTDETLYQEARRINIAIYQNIIYKEWLPLIVGDVLVKEFKLAITQRQYFFGYNESVNPSLAAEFAGAAYRFGHSLITGFYSKCDEDLNIFRNLSLSTLMFRPREAYTNGGLDAICRGLLFETGSKMDSHLTDAVQNRLFEDTDKIKDTHRFSLSAVNIQRGRDHGLPGYNEFRVLAGLGRARSFSDLVEIPAAVREELAQVYESVDDIDAFTGGLSEEAFGGGGILGRTFGTIVARQFWELKAGDRFYFENGESTRVRFSGAQMEEIKRVGMAAVMCWNLELNVVQERAFEAAGSGNGLVECGSLGRIDMREWRNEIV